MPRVAEPRPGEPITRVALKDGSSRYRAVADVGTARHRRQQRLTFKTLTEARAWLAEVRTDLRRGVHVAPSALTFNALADSYLRLAANRVRPNTLQGYEQSLAYPRAAFGSTLVQDVTRDDILAMVEGMAERGLSARTAVGALVHTRAAFELAIEDRVVSANPARRVKAKGTPPKEMLAHTEQERDLLKSAAADDWLSACWLLSMAGLRRSEILGLRWSDVDFKASTLTVRRSRVMVDSKRTEEGAPKTANSARVLELTPAFMKPLKRMRARHMEILGPGHGREGYLAVDEVGRPVRPEHYSDLWKRLCATAKVRVLRLHEARHGSVSLMRAKGVPDQIIAAFHGHDEQTMRRTYSHLQPGDLRAAAKSL